MGSQRYILKKVLQALVTLLFVLCANFFLFRMMPGDPVNLLARSQQLSREDIADQIKSLGICDPPPGVSRCSKIDQLKTFPTYAAATLTGNLGKSVRQPVAVTELIADKIWPTVLLLGLGTLFSTAIGLWVGIKGGWNRGSKFDTSTLFGSLVFYSMPEGWLGMILIIFFAGVLGVFPAGGYQSSTQLTGIAHLADVANHLFLPVLTLTLGYIGEYAIIMRSSLLEVMGDDFVQTARAKGVRERSVRRNHVVPNAFLPTFTLIFLSIGFVLGGAVVIETVFSWPGLGLLTVKAIDENDYPVLQGVFLLSSVAVIFFNLIADLTYGYLDPRIRS